MTKKRGGDDSSPNPDKGHSGRRKRKCADRLCNESTGANMCMLHGHGNSIEESKVLGEYIKRYVGQWLHKGDQRRG